MYAYRRIASPGTVEAARERAAELSAMFRFERYLVAEIAWEGRDEVDLVAVSESEDEGYDSMNAVMVAYIEWHEDHGAAVRSIAEATAR